MTLKMKQVLVALKRMRNEGTIADIRKAANVTAGDRIARSLIDQGFMRQSFRDCYVLTPGGIDKANKLIEGGM